MPNFSANSLMASGSSSSTTSPRIWRRSLYLFCSSTRAGISARQGPHQVAQKFSRMTLPWESARVTGFPSRLVSLKSGAGSGLRTKRMMGWLESCAGENEGKKPRSNEVTRQEKKERRFLASTAAKSKRRTARSRAQQAALTIEKRVCQFISLHVQLASGIAQYFCEWPNSEFIVSSYCDVMLGSFQIRRDAIVGVDLGRSQRRQCRRVRPAIDVINKAKKRKAVRFMVLRCAAVLIAVAVPESS